MENEWERELMEQMRPSNDLWRSMASCRRNDRLR